MATILSDNCSKHNSKFSTHHFVSTAITREESSEEPRTHMGTLYFKTRQSDCVVPRNHESSAIIESLCLPGQLELFLLAIVLSESSWLDHFDALNLIRHFW